MYLVVERDRYGTLEIAMFETIDEAQRFIELLSKGRPNNYSIVVRSPLKLK